MKWAVAALAALGTVSCSLEPANYRPPSSRYLPATQSGPATSYLAPGGPPPTSYGRPDYRAGPSRREHYRHQHSGADDQHEPARYEFGYQVRDHQGNDYGHREAREGSRTRGTYHVLLPDGRRQIVEYEADEWGFKPRVTYEAADAPGPTPAVHSAYPGAPY